MKIKVSAIALTTLFISINCMAQSDYVSDMSSAYYQQWYTDYEQTGIKINDISAIYEQQVAKRGYPKKKTVKIKMELIEHYVQLLQNQLVDPRLNKDVDKEKIQRKIDEWQTQYVMLKALLKKI
jgi:hypothetical protein